MLRRPAGRLRTAVPAAVAGSVLVIALAGCGQRSGADRPAGPSPAGAAGAATGPATGSGTPRPTSAAPSGDPAPAGASPTGAAPASSGPAGSLPDGLTAADVAAGLRSDDVPQVGGRRLVPVPGDVPAPGSGREVRVRVEVEAGLDVDPQAFATFVLATLNDPRSWGHGGRLTFARTDGAATVRVVLASPDTSAAMCRPLVTYGRLSCHAGDAAVLTLYRWVKAIPEYGTDRTGYRHYVVNHEVGHALGHGHEFCPGPGRRAPVMMQQTKGLKGCLPNSWPFP